MSLDRLVNTRKSCICYPLQIIWYKILKLFICALVISYESYAIGFLIRIVSIRYAFIIEQSKVRVWIVVICRPGPLICNPNVHVAKPVVFSMCEAKVRAGVDNELTTDFFVGCNFISVVFLIKCGVVWQSVYTLDPTYLVQYTPDCK